MRVLPTHRPTLLGIGSLAVAGLVAGLATAPATAQAAPRLQEHSTLAELSVDGDASDGSVRATAPVDRPVARPDGLPGNASDATVARAHLVDAADELGGVDTDASSLKATGTTEIPGVGPVVRFTQVVGGVPVVGGGLVVSLDESGGLRSVGGQTTDVDAPLTFVVSANAAAEAARAAVVRKHPTLERVLRVLPPRKVAYDPAIVGDAGTGVRPVWKVLVAGPNGSSDTFTVQVDATDGHVINVLGDTETLQRAICDAGGQTHLSDPNPSFDSDAAYLAAGTGWCGANLSNQIIRDTNNDGWISDAFWNALTGIPLDSPETLSVPYARTEGAPDTGVADVDTAYDSLGDTANFYQAALGVDLTALIGAKDSSIGNGSASTRRLAGTVRYCLPREAFYGLLSPYTVDWHGAAGYFAEQYCPYGNAYWSDFDQLWMPTDGPYPGGQMAFGAGFTTADDVVGHELTHGVTAATNQLLYYKEAGAINESMSDVFGQLVQEYKNPGSDPTWLVGDDLDTPTLYGALRDMSNPANPFLPEGSELGQPDHMTRPSCQSAPTVGCWDTDPTGADDGGVHTNSGVGNKAAYLIAHGGSFNGYSVARLDQANAADSQPSTVKVAKLYWATQQLLPANATYRDLGYYLDRACRTLATNPSSGFTAADCTNSVDRAVNATRMNLTRASITTSTKALTYGGSAKLTMRVGDARNTGAGGTTVTLQKKVRGSTSWSNVTRQTSSSSSSTLGKKYVTVKPTRSTYYRTVVSTKGVLRSAVSTSVLVSVRSSLSKKLSAKKIKYRKSFSVKGSVRPVHGGTVYLQRYYKGKWRTVAKDRLSSKGAYSLRYKPKSKKDLNYRVYAPATTSLAAGVSSKFKVTVK